MSEKRTIRELRMARGWSQMRLAVEADISLSTVYALEANRNEPRIEQMLKLMRIFDVKWEEVEWPRKEKMTAAA